MSNRAWFYILLACTVAITVVVLAIMNTWMVG